MVKHAGVDFSRLGAHQHWAGEVREEIDAHPTLVIGWNDRHHGHVRAPRGEKRFSESAVSLLPNHHVQWGCAEQPLRLRLPSHLLRQGVSGRWLALRHLRRWRPLRNSALSAMEVRIRLTILELFREELPQRET